MSFMKLKIFILLFITFSDLFTFVFHFIIGFWLYAYSLIGPFLLLFYYLFLYMYIFLKSSSFLSFHFSDSNFNRDFVICSSYCPFWILDNGVMQKFKFLKKKRYEFYKQKFKFLKTVMNSNF